MGSVRRSQVIPPSLRYFLNTDQLIHNPTLGGRQQITIPLMRLLSCSSQGGVGPGELGSGMGGGCWLALASSATWACRTAKMPLGLWLFTGHFRKFLSF